MNIPIEIIIFSLMFICAVGIFIGAWMRGLGHDDEARQMNDQIMLYKSRWEASEKIIKNMPTTLDYKTLFHDLHSEYAHADLRNDKSDEWKSGLKSGLKMAILLVNPKI